MLIVHLFLSYAHVNLCHFFSFSWCQAATSACGSSLTFMFTYFHNSTRRSSSVGAHVVEAQKHLRVTEAEIRKQLIWGNKYIQTKGKTIFYENWNKSNIYFIDDLLDETRNMKRGSEILQHLQGYSRAIEYNTILKSIPKTWNNMLKDINMGISAQM